MAKFSAADIVKPKRGKRPTEAGKKLEALIAKANKADGGVLIPMKFGKGGVTLALVEGACKRLNLTFKSVGPYAKDENKTLILF